MVFNFADRAAFQLLLLIPVLFFFAVWVWARSRALIQARISPKLGDFLQRSLSNTRRRWKLVLQCLVMFFFIFALARPQSGEGHQKAKSEGVEIALAIDVSNSMMSEDVRPNRLELVKKELTRLLDQFSGDRVALVAFAGSSILLSPLTPDKAAIKMYIESLTPQSVATQGTNFRKAIEEAYGAMDRGGVDSDSETHVTKVIILVSDGEDNEQGALDAAQKIAKEGVRIFTLGVGTLQGGPIPLRDQMGNLLGYKRDEKGRDIVSRSTGESLEKVAKAGQGTFHQITFGGDAVKFLKTEIDRLQKTQFDTLDFKQYTEHYQIFLFLGILLALIELLLGERRSEGRLWMGRFEVPKS